MPIYDPQILEEKRRNLIRSLHSEYIELVRSGRELSTEAIKIYEELKRLVEQHK